MKSFLAQGAIPEAVNLVDKASQMSDRWLFLALLVVVISGAVYIIRYLIQVNKEMAITHNEFMRSVYTDSIKLTTQVLVALEDNNKLLQKISDHLEREGRKPS